ncbi:hypothetical protein C8R48DRAFT_782931 [Suillus tomentosus]|nr:hypothetical protein C8R48DRAFT_782931 [Suillus tomentosus]
MGVAGWRHISDWPSSPNAWLRGSPLRQAWYTSGGATPVVRWGVTLSSFAAWPVELYIEWQWQRPPAIYDMGGQHTDAQWPVELYIMWADHPLSLTLGDGRHSSQGYHSPMPLCVISSVMDAMENRRELSTTVKFVMHNGSSVWAHPY